jgi:negative regulator of flagellin synthesis FlgM
VKINFPAPSTNLPTADVKPSTTRVLKEDAPVKETPVLALSDAQNRTQPGDIDTARVAQIREALNSGELTFSSARISEGLRQSVAEMLGQVDA